MADTQGRNPTSRTPGSEGAGPYNFRCSEIHSSCNWQTSGSSEDEVMHNVERHGREAHGLSNWDENTRNRVRSSIKQRT